VKHIKYLSPPQLLNQNYFFVFPFQKCFYMRFGCFYWLRMWKFCIRGHVHWPVTIPVTTQKLWVFCGSLDLAEPL